MSSTFTINFSLRQNKAIERAIAFDALLAAKEHLGQNPIYVGLGSVWFRDFVLAHRTLGIETMVSMEGEPTVFARAGFNRPFGTIEVVPGWSNDVLPSLLSRPDLAERPWIVWLDYDREMDENRRDELVNLVRSLPAGSALLTTFNAKGANYGADTDDRREVLAELFGDSIVDLDADEPAFKDYGLMKTLAHAVSDYLVSVAIHSGREGGYIPALRLLYRDSANMVTVGGFLPSTDQSAELTKLTTSPEWFGFEDVVIETQPLTVREIYALWRLLPSSSILTVDQVKALGFELSEDELRFFQRHYLRYPTYAETV
jgi:hypothetical protein